MKLTRIDIDKEFTQDGYNNLVAANAKDNLKRLNELGYSFQAWESDIFKHIAVIFDKAIIMKYSFGENDMKGTYFPRSHYISRLIQAAINHHETHK